VSHVDPRATAGRRSAVGRAAPHRPDPAASWGLSVAEVQSIVTRARYGDPPVRRVRQALRRLVGTTADVRQVTADIAGLQRPVATGRRIVVAGPRGGGGRSTVAALLAAVLASRRNDQILALDAASDLGSLAWRLGVEDPQGLAELGPALLDGRGNVHTLLPRSPAGLWVLPGVSANAAPVPVTAARDVARAMSRWFAVTVADCAAGLTDPATTAVLGDAHATVLVCPATLDGVRSARVALDRTAARGNPGVTGRTVVVLVSQSRDEVVGVRAAVAAVSVHGALGIHLPFDRHLAAGGPLQLRRLGEAGRSVATSVAALTLARAVTS
jgi:MinD-like ATPase involved in chromosome partitioning or flagellar assembly